MAYKKVLRKKTNPTTQVVREAMKETAKDVRAPKVVRDGIVSIKKKKINPPIPKFNTGPKSATVDYIILDDSIKFKSKHIKNVPNFSQTKESVLVPSYDSQFKDHYVTGRITCDDIVVEIDVKDKKLLKLMNLFHAQKKISFSMALKDKDIRIVSNGFLKSIEESIDGKVSFTYCPDYFSVL